MAQNFQAELFFMKSEIYPKILKYYIKNAKNTGLSFSGKIQF